MGAELLLRLRWSAIRSVGSFAVPLFASLLFCALFAVLFCAIVAVVATGAGRSEKPDCSLLARGVEAISPARKRICESSGSVAIVLAAADVRDGVFTVALEGLAAAGFVATIGDSPTVS
jgi:hypothetical protein